VATNERVDPDLPTPNRTAHGRDARRQAQPGRRARESSNKPKLQTPTTMANRGYDVVVDVDQEVRISPAALHEAPDVGNETTSLTNLQGDLGHTDLQEDLEFHSSSTLSPYCLHIVYTR
jgi:hypothetical protein